MAQETLPIQGLGTSAAPLTYTISNVDAFTLSAVRAIFDGTGAAGTFMPCVQLLSAAGTVMAQTVADPVAAGSSADATFAPFLGSAGSSSGYNTIEDEGTAVTKRKILNFHGAGVNVVDNAGALRTDVTVPGGTVVAGTWVAPVFGLLPNSIVAYGQSNLYGTRFVVPFTGTLHDLSIYINPPSGNVNVGIYDTSATTRNRLYQTGNVTMGVTAGVWKIMGDPALAVTQGDQIDFVIVCDNNLGKQAFVQLGAGNGFAGPLPPGFLVSPLGGLPLMSWVVTSTATIPATLAEASLGPWSNAPIILARIV